MQADIHSEIMAAVQIFRDNNNRKMPTHLILSNLRFLELKCSGKYLSNNTNGKYMNLMVSIPVRDEDDNYLEVA